MSISLVTRGIISGGLFATSSGVITRYINYPVCDPDLSAYAEGILYVRGEGFRPAIRMDTEDIRPSIKGYIEGEQPSMESEDLKPALRAFPVPNNL
jgi:hypothetical protein